MTGLTWGVGGLVIVEGVDLDVQHGEFVSIIGPNGAGKTSLINLISGVYMPRSGVIELNGEDITKLRPERTRREAVPSRPRACSRGCRWAKRATRSPGRHRGAFVFTSRHDDEATTKANEVLETGLLRRREDRVGELSHGDKRKLELAMVLAADPELLLLDEPTAGVSAEETAPLVEVIQDVHRSGRAIVMVEHRMEFVVDVSERSP